MSTKNSKNKYAIKYYYKNRDKVLQKCSEIVCCDVCKISMRKSSYSKHIHSNSHIHNDTQQKYNCIQQKYNNIIGTMTSICAQT